MTPLIIIGMKRFKPWIMENFGINFIRGTFAAGVASVFIMAGLIYLKVTAANDTTPVVVKKKRVGQCVLQRCALHYTHDPSQARHRGDHDCQGV